MSFGGGYSETSADKTAAKAAQQQADLTQQIWNTYGKTAADQALYNQLNLNPVTAGLTSYLYGGTNTGAKVPGSVASAVAGSTTYSPSDTDYSAAWSAIGGNGNPFAKEGYASRGVSQADMLNELAGRYGMTDAMQTAFKAKLAEAAAAPTAEQSTWTTQTFDPTQWFGKTVAAPTLQDVPDWKAVGQQYADTMNTGGLTGINNQLHSALSASSADLAARNLGDSSYNATREQALNNMARREQAELSANTLSNRMAAEAALRGEANANTTAAANWQQAQNDSKLSQLSAILGILQGGTTPTYNPYSASQATGQAASTAAQVAQNQYERWANQQRQTTGNIGTLGSLLGMAFGR